MSLRRELLRAIDKEMKRQGLSQRDLARILGCSLENIRQLLDERKPGMQLASVEKLAQALGFGVSLVLTPRAAAGTVAPPPTFDSGEALIDLDKARDLDS